MPSPQELAAREQFYALAAKRYKAELRLYGATACVHLENKNDEVFWGKVLKYAHPKAKFRFIFGSRNVNGNMTYGCSQCLNYQDFLDEQFLIAIDSDYRYLTCEPFINARNYILQTYTYSFENHFCYADNLNRALQEACGAETPLTHIFDFRVFLDRYSRIVYPLLVWQLYLSGVGSGEDFPRHVFHRLLSLTIGAKTLADNGKYLLDVLATRTGKMIAHLRRRFPEYDYTWFEARCADLGVRADNAYLFVRGHQLYDCIHMIGRKLLSQWRKEHYSPTEEAPTQEKSFECCMTKWLCFGEYEELDNIVKDIRSIYGLVAPMEGKS